MFPQILDWRKKEIPALEVSLSESDQRNAVYQRYLNYFEAKIGLKRSDGDLFGRIHNEYKQHPFLKELFPSYDLFFNAFLLYPYKFSLMKIQEESLSSFDFTDKLPEDNEKDKKITRFLREHNLPFLINAALERYSKKLEKLLPYLEIIQKEKVLVQYNFNKKESLEGVLMAEFSPNLWSNVISNFNDCIFITYSPEENKVIFQDYWFASFMHQLHPRIYYLNFIVSNDKEGKDLRNKFRFPLLKMVLMETDNAKYPLLVEGLLGSDLDNLKIKSGSFDNIRDFIDFSVWQFFSNCYQKDNPDSELLYFPNHQPKSSKPYSQFDDYVKGKYRKFSSSDLPVEIKVQESDGGFELVRNLAVKKPNG